MSNLAREKPPAPQEQQQQQQHYHMQQQAPVYEQPHGAAPMSLQGAPPAHNAAQPGHERPWSTGLCACGNDVPGFCLAFWCPCMAYGQYKERYDHLAQTGRPKPKDQVESCGTPGVLYLVVHCLTGFGFVLDFMARGDIRKRYGIQGGALGDCCTACCCMPCTQRQHHRELAVEEEQQWGAMQQTGQQSQQYGQAHMQPQSQAYPPEPALS